MPAARQFPEEYDNARLVQKDWYEHRDELRQDQIFVTLSGGFVKLDRTVPGDGTQWYVANWWNGSWAYMDDTLEPGELMDLVEAQP